MAPAPQFMAVLPLGFAAATATINPMPSDMLAETCNGLLRYLKDGTSSVGAGLLQHQLSAVGTQASLEEIESACNALTYVLRGAMEDTLSSDALSAALKARTDLNQVACGTICHVYAAQVRSWLLDAPAPLSNSCARVRVGRGGWSTNSPPSRAAAVFLLA